jgi:hypothetical protein
VIGHGCDLDRIDAISHPGPLLFNLATGSYTVVFLATRCSVYLAIGIVLVVSERARRICSPDAAMKLIELDRMTLMTWRYQ